MKHLRTYSEQSELCNESLRDQMKGISDDKYIKLLNNQMDKYIKNTSSEYAEQYTYDDVITLFDFYEKHFKISERNLFFHLADNGFLSYDDILDYMYDNAIEDVMELIDKWEDEKSPKEIVTDLYDIPLIYDDSFTEYLIHEFQILNKDEKLNILKFMKNNLINIK